LYQLPEAETTLAEVLRENGYRTAAFVAAAVLDHRFGISQGFEIYDDEAVDRGLEQLIAERDAAAVVAEAEEWLRSLGRSAPFFLWVHFFDPHHPYQPPEPFDADFRDAPYDGEIAFSDEQLGVLLGVLEEMGQRERTLIVVCSDHGESLGQHREETHGIFIYDATLRVPLILSGPGIPAGDRRQEGPVGLVDVFPTVLARLGIEAPSGVSGEDLLSSRRTEDVLYAESFMPRDFYNWSELRAVRSDRYKYIDAPRPELYDLSSDAGESRNIIEEEPSIARRLASRLSSLGGEGEESGFQPDTELVTLLRALGYVAEGRLSESVDRSVPRPDPKDNIEIVARLDEAIGFFESGRWAEAEARLSRILEDDEGNFLARHYYAETLFHLEREPQAIEAYRRTVEAGRDSAYYRVRLAVLHDRLGRYAEAAEEYGRAMDLDPDVAVEVLERSRELLQSGVTDGALSYLEVLDQEGASGPALALMLAEAWHRKGELEKALQAIDKGIENKPGESRFLAARGSLLMEMGRSGEALSSFEQSLAELSDEDEKLRVLKNMAELAEKANDLESAARYFKRALDIRPMDFESLANLALTYVRAGNVDAALEPLEQALTVRPDEVRLLNLKAEIHFQRGEPEKSLALLRRSLEVRPDQPRIVEALAQVEASLKKR
jgi:tetratricopeptide (TPR) repeat protein